ncbi:UDP-glucose/GDP-mannose dehydrogenase family protein [Bacillus sp. BRMEA1]|uniref:UDP-glucose dehydrogenase family protein n=1 Tax=Neobacillus endophyticus TaxID=2738405 RepID=UPI0015674D6E|nr:UDP-glucose/GDP-mannose dehydrogenase family protein [Neobacillus endophyticus]NRD77395.1 UDP-glucose/GDP-mannose dehydrogenase family protein [Neobacillus endophyticus]
MKITVTGAGYVGLVTSVCLAELGHQVITTDIQKEKIEMLQNGISPIYEPGLPSLLEKNLGNGRLRFTMDPDLAYSDAEIIFIAVGTPETDNGSIDLKYLYVAAFTIAHHIENDVVICTKSTVPVGTNDIIHQIINSRKPDNILAEVVSNPEFLREGSAVYDFFHGDRIVIGTNNPEAANIMEQLYLPLKIPILKTDLKSAEMIKYASNAFLATKISFINEIASICEKVGANIEEVAYGMGSDKRIGFPFLQAGIGFGGSCLPKDTNALLQLTGCNEQRFELLEAVMKVNRRQHSLPIVKAKELLGPLQNKKAALLGLAYKPDTDDVRESTSLIIAKELLEEGAYVTAYDPVATPNFQKMMGNSISYASDIPSALHGADFAIIATEWDQIKHVPLDVFSTNMKRPIIIDGRNCYSLQEVQKYPITYISVGRPAIDQKGQIIKDGSLF